MNVKIEKMLKEKSITFTTPILQCQLLCHF